MKDNEMEVVKGCIYCKSACTLVIPRILPKVNSIDLDGNTKPDYDIYTFDQKLILAKEINENHFECYAEGCGKSFQVKVVVRRPVVPEIEI